MQMDIELLIDGSYTQKEWLHEVLSFVILFCNCSPGSGKTTIYKNSDGLYCANIDGGALQLGGANTLYSAFSWFHSHIEEYSDALTDAYQMNSRSWSFAHAYSSNYILLRRTALLEMPKVCLKKHYFPLTPLKFYKLLFIAHRLYHPDLFILDLKTDTENHKKAKERL